MGYATLADLAARYSESELVELTDREGVGDVDVARVARALDDASAAIDDALRAGGYPLPLPQVPTSVVEQACTLARCRLYDVTMPEHVRAVCDDARGWLDRVASRRLVLDVGATEPPSGGTALPSAGARTLTYTDATWSRYAL